MKTPTPQSDAAISPSESSQAQPTYPRTDPARCRKQRFFTIHPVGACANGPAATTAPVGGGRLIRRAAPSTNERVQFRPGFFARLFHFPSQPNHLDDGRAPPTEIRRRQKSHRSEKSSEPWAPDDQERNNAADRPAVALMEQAPLIAATPPFGWSSANDLPPRRLTPGERQSNNPTTAHGWRA
jgi:hypothetical protein